MFPRLLNVAKTKFSIANITSRYSSQIAAKHVFSDESSDIGSFNVGTKVHGFSVKDIQVIQEFNVTAVHLQHEKTKAEYLHLYRNDSNNVFSINFRTTPMNSTGLPHILEHTVLCGSKLYPVRDPFFKMLNRSLATFMNAMTSSDFTMYPFSTQNYSDYKNLQKIYLDAVFRPNIREVDFMQEGWRLEHVDPTNKTTDITIKGIVYNEMKGVFSENENILQQNMQNLLLPDHTYSVCSGGDPMKIPDMTWDALKEFHQKHYHPSNSRFYSYGNFPVVPTLQYINEEYLSKFDYQDCEHTKVPPTKRWVCPKKEHILCRVESMREQNEQQNTIVVSYVMTDVKDIYETFLVQFISELLIRGTNAPFYKSLIEPNISGGYSPSTGFDCQMRDSVFTLGLQGLKSDDFEKVQNLFNKTIDEVMETGFEEKHIESVLHSYELSLKHETSNFGLSLLYMIMPIWNHNGNVIEDLRFKTHINKLKKEMEKDAQYLQKAVRKYFKDNNHKLVLTMSPDKEYEMKQMEQENKLIQGKVSALSAEDKKKVFEKGLELLEEQKKVQDTNLLPTLSIGDISNDIPKVAKDKLRVQTVPTQVFKVDTNGIVYFKGILNTSALSPEQQMMLPLFCSIVTKLGTDKLNYREFDNLAQCKTSGLSLRSHIGDSLYQLHSYEPGILLTSYCLKENVESMWELWSQIFNLSTLKDVARFEMLVKIYMTNLMHGIADQGHVYAMLAAQGLVSGTAYQKDLLNGLQHISYMKRLIKTSSYAPMLDELTNIAKILFDRNNFRCALNLQETSKDTILKTFNNFVNELPSNSPTVPNGQMYTSTKVWVPTDSVNCHHHVLNVPVNYCSKGILTVPYTNTDYAKLQILSRLCTAKYLHPELRERQGAYGGGVKLSLDGVMSYYSYRDPRNVETLDVFDNTHTWLKDNINKLTEQDILEAKLGVFQTVDAPVPPGTKGLQEFLYGLTPDVLQRHRAALMVVNKEGLLEVTEKYLVGTPLSKVGKAVLGPKSMETVNRADELWTVVDNE